MMRSLLAEEALTGIWAATEALTMKRSLLAEEALSGIWAATEALIMMGSLLAEEPLVSPQASEEITAIPLLRSSHRRGSKDIYA